jgi:hypothetical protein
MRALWLWMPGLILFAAIAHADPVCGIPDDLVMHDLAFPIAKHAVATAHRIDILALGGAFTSGTAAGDPQAAYPVRLQAELTALLPGVTVSVVSGAKPGSTLEATVATIATQIATSGARLVIWAPGAHDIVSHPDVDGFATNLETGIDIVRTSGADLMLMDMQYVPLFEQWSRIEDYRAMLRGTADAHDVPIFPRHELMRAWSDAGMLDLAASDKADQARMIRDLFACVAKGLAAPIAGAVR